MPTPSAKVVLLLSTATLQAKDVNGDWRDLASGDSIYDQEEIFARADGPQFAQAAYKVQRLVAGVWTDALTVSLNVKDGTGIWRQDKFAIGGDNVDSTASLSLTVAKGPRQAAHDLSVLQVQQTDEGGRFSYPARNGTKFAGLFSSLERTSDAEMGGFQEGIDAQLVTDREQWALAGKSPVVGQDLMWIDSSSSYRIVKVETDEISYVISLASVNK
jgi:hypothetical protein